MLEQFPLCITQCALASGADRNVHSLVRKAERNRPADAFAGAGHHCAR
jgi:hypothetical protein